MKEVFHMDIFDGKVLMVTGGTGSFGHAVVRRFLKTKIKEIRILSRDEKKQDDMRKEFDDDKLKFYIGDVRDYARLADAFKGVDYCFSAAALKQVPSCEFYPLEATKTNVLGSNNVISACVANHVKKAIFLSTDKAAYPINAMGITKALMEKNVIARSRQLLAGDTVLCLTRYGNVMASRGSVIPLFLEQIEAGRPITITNGNMTRFMMTLDDAVDLVIFAFEHGEQGDLFVQKGPVRDHYRPWPKPSSNSPAPRPASRTSGPGTARSFTRPSSPPRRWSAPRTWAGSSRSRRTTAT
jgi:UDP-N-acetylglucosamine 4,6-dehydratase